MPPQNIENVSQQVKLGKFAASKLIIKESWNVLQKDREIVWFPILSSLFALLVLCIMAGVYVMVVLGGDIRAFDSEATQIGEVGSYALLFLYYLITFFIINFFEAGLLTVVQARFSGQDLTWKDGMKGAQAHGMKIFWWSLISATVGMVLRIISDRSRLVGKIVAALFGAAWAILTYFSLPSLVIGNLGIKESFKESAALIRKNWGETLIVNYGVGFIFGILIFVLIAVSVFTAVMLGSVLGAIIVGVVFVILMLILSIIYSALNSIFKLVLFNYARTGVVPAGFTSDVVRASLKAK